MFLVNQAMEHISIGTAGIIVVLGMIVVFIGLILLMWVTQIAGKIMVASEKRKAAKLPPSRRPQLPLFCPRPSPLPAPPAR
jgi:Na+-transporting methylmalonyl-CoA/oxaloacetate decarboxylase gamma subunit